MRSFYNTLDVLVDAGLVVRHQITVQSVQYELRIYADTHLHFGLYEMRGHPGAAKQYVESGYEKLEVSRFTPEYYCLYILWPVQ